jgi:uncharacterized protein (TIGR03435 family)
MKASTVEEAASQSSVAFQANAPEGSRLSESYSEGRVEWRGQGVTMRQLIVALTPKTDRPIIDKTDLTEWYDFTMSWSTGDLGDTIYSAVEKYLGLKLVPHREATEMLVIDRLERAPTEN